MSSPTQCREHIDCSVSLRPYRYGVATKQSVVEVHGINDPHRTPDTGGDNDHPPTFDDEGNRRHHAGGDGDLRDKRQCLLIADDVL